MSSPKNPPLVIPSDDKDLADQAHPGHGVPSQDPDLAAQFVLTPSETERETESVLVGGGMAAGAASGAGIGALVGGPVGVLVGASVGALAGALGGAAAASTANMETTTHVVADVDEQVYLHIDDTGGGGRPVVLIHGWPLSAQAWVPQMPVLSAAGYRVVAYDRRGFGRSAKPNSDYSYNTLADDLMRVLDLCGLQDVTLLGFSMGGGEVARFIGRCGEQRLHSVVFAAAVPPCLMQTADNPLGPLKPEAAQASRRALEQDREAFFDTFTRHFFSAHGVLKVNEFQRSEAIALCLQSAPYAALACMDAFHTTDFRDDLKKITVPTLVIHGDADAIVPVEGSGDLTHRAVPHSQMVKVGGAPHGFNLSHAQAFNDGLLSFLKG